MTCSFLAFFLFSINVTAQSSEEESVVLVLVPELSFAEATWLYTWGQHQDIWQQASFAGMNIRPDGPYSYLNNAVSLSMGVRGVGVQGWNAFEPREKIETVLAKDVMKQWTGGYPQDSLLHPYFHKLVDKNKQSTYQGEVAILGEALKQHGVSTYVMGHSDIEGEKIRYGSLFTMDQQGETKGSVVKGVVNNPQFPASYQMDGDIIVDSIQQREKKQSSLFTVVEWGDFQRLFSIKEEMTDEHFQKQYESSLNQLEQFIVQLIGERTVILLSPMMHQEAYKEKKQLAPIWVWHKEKMFPQVMYSETTNQEAIISNLDIVPTILSLYNIDKPAILMGQPLQLTMSEGYDHTTVFEEVNLAFTIYQSRGVILSSYITLLTILLVAISILLWRKAANRLWIKLAKVLLVSAVSSPFWFLTTPRLLTIVDVGYYFWLLSFFSIVTGYLLTTFVKKPLLLVGAAHVFVLTVDLLLGNPLMQRSYLGYDPIIGARYYGIGNEYAGVYIVSVLLVLTPCFRKQTWYTSALIGFMLAGLLFMLGASHLGTNAGATLAAGVACGYLLFQYVPIKRKRNVWAGAVILAIAAFGLLFLLQLTGKTTHIGYAFERLLSGDFSYAYDVIKRKLAMNWKIFKYSNWTQLFVTSYILIGFVLWRQKRIVRDKAEKTVLQTGIVASVALLVLNDSGVVAAATSMFLLVALSYYWMLEEKERVEQK